MYNIATYDIIEALYFFYDITISKEVLFPFIDGYIKELNNTDLPVLAAKEIYEKHILPFR